MIGNDNFKEEDFVEQDIRTMDPYKVIQSAAEGMGIVIQPPKKNCKHCHGRGWTGRKASTGEPIPCRCIFPKFDSEKDIGDIEMKPRNRAERRAKK